MNISILHQAFSIIEKHKAASDFYGENRDETIREAEKILNISFPNSYRIFLKTYGAGDISGCELYGIIGKFETPSSVPDMVWLTLQERNDGNLPKDCIVIYMDYDGLYYALDCSIVNKYSESPVVKVYDKNNYEVIFDDYGSFLLHTLKHDFNLTWVE